MLMQIKIVNCFIFVHQDHSVSSREFISCDISKFNEFYISYVNAKNSRLKYTRTQQN